MEKIQINPDICNGKAVIKGTRITVSTILEYLSAGDSFDDILTGYPNLTKNDILACLQYAYRITASHSAVKMNVWKNFLLTRICPKHLSCKPMINLFMYAILINKWDEIIQKIDEYDLLEIHNTKIEGLKF